MSEFIEVAKTSEITDGGKMLVEADDRLVILFRIAEQYFCIDDVCTHDGGTLSDGCLLYTSPSPRDKRQSRMPSSA